MKQLLIVIAIAAVGFTTVTYAADVIDSQVIDSAIAYEKAGGQAEFMGGDVLKSLLKTMLTLKLPRTIATGWLKVLTKASLTYASKHHVVRKLLQYR